MCSACPQDHRLCETNSRLLRASELTLNIAVVLMTSPLVVGSIVQDLLVIGHGFSHTPVFSVHQSGSQHFRRLDYTISGYRVIESIGHGLSSYVHGLSVIGHGLSVIGHGLSVIGHGLSVIGHGLSVIAHGLSFYCSHWTWPLSHWTWPLSHCTWPLGHWT